MLTMRQIRKATPSSIFGNHEYSRVVKMSRGRTKAGARFVRALTCSPWDNNGFRRANPPQYSTSVVVVGTRAKKVAIKSAWLMFDYIKCSCSCPYFTFYGCEVELWKRGAADIYYSNGKDPIVRNPAERPWACKHLLALFDKIDNHTL